MRGSVRAKPFCFEKTDGKALKYFQVAKHVIPNLAIETEVWDLSAQFAAAAVVVVISAIVFAMKTSW